MFSFRILGLVLSVIFLVGLGPAKGVAEAAVQSPEIVAISDGSQAFDVADTRPDIFVLMVDDLGYIQDDRILKSQPEIRKLFLKSGMRFTQMYNETPLCCPARANFHSGQHTLTNGVYRNDPRPMNQNKTLAMAMNAAGYTTMLVGKYLNGYSGKDVPPGWDEAFIRNRLDVPDFWVNGKLVSYRGRFYDDVVKDKAVAWLKTAPRNKPVFEFIAPWAPHIRGSILGKKCKSDTCKFNPKVMKRDRRSPRCKRIDKFKPPNYFIKKNRVELPKDMPNWPNGWPLRKTCESLLVVDRMVGKLVSAQKERGRPAYFFFMSDNGMSWGQEGFPLKHVPTSTRLPFYVTGPGIAKGRMSGELLSIIDIPVTISDIAGAKMPWADGISFLPLLKGRAFAGNQEILELMYRPSNKLKWLGWKAIRIGTWVYRKWDFGKRQLFRYRKDPFGLRNRIKAEPELAESLDQLLNSLFAETNKRY